jgi:hypothetical protein
MKKTGKAGLGHLKKMEKKSREVTAARAELGAATELKKTECRPRKRCGC